MEFLRDAARSVAAYSGAWGFDGIIGAGIVAAVDGVVHLALDAEVGVPSVVTMEPRQIWSGARHKEVQGPADDDVVVKGNVEGYQNCAETHPCEEGRESAVF